MPLELPVTTAVCPFSDSLQSGMKNLPQVIVRNCFDLYPNTATPPVAAALSDMVHSLYDSVHISHARQRFLTRLRTWT